eukprot:Skav216691  [mRNA]  locus=scaffold91:204892:208586:+ [translate_table: standard]
MRGRILALDFHRIFTPLPSELAQTQPLKNSNQPRQDGAMQQQLFALPNRIGQNWYFAVIGAAAAEEEDLPATPRAAVAWLKHDQLALPVSVLQRYPLEDHSDCRFPPALASFCFPRGGKVTEAHGVLPARAPVLLTEASDSLHGFVLTNEAGDRCFGAAPWKQSGRRSDGPPDHRTTI